MLISRSSSEILFEKELEKGKTLNTLQEVEVI